MKSKCCNKEIRVDKNMLSYTQEEVSEDVGRLLKQADDLHKHRTVPPSKKEIHDLVTTAYEAGRETPSQNEVDLGEALLDMYEQYCGEYGHSFISAGENASTVLETLGFANFDDAGKIINKNYETK